MKKQTPPKKEEEDQRSYKLQRQTKSLSTRTKYAHEGFLLKLLIHNNCSVTFLQRTFEKSSQHNPLKIVQIRYNTISLYDHQAIEKCVKTILNEVNIRSNHSIRSYLLQERGNRIIGQLKENFHIQMETEEIEKKFEEFDTLRIMVTKCEFNGTIVEEDELLDIGEKFYNLIKSKHRNETKFEIDINEINELHQPFFH